MMNCLLVKNLLYALAFLCVGIVFADKFVRTDVTQFRFNTLNVSLNGPGPGMTEDPLFVLDRALKKYRGSIELHFPLPPNESEMSIKIVSEDLMVECPYNVNCNEYCQLLVRRATFRPVLEKLNRKQLALLQQAHEQWRRGGPLHVHASDCPKFYKRYCSLPGLLQHQRLFDITHPRETLPYIGGILKALRVLCSYDGAEYY